MEQITYKKLADITELHEVTHLIEKVWGNEGFINPFLFLAQVHAGSLILGAYDNDQLVGMNYGFIGKEGSLMYLYSHMLAIDEPYRGLGIGGKLKSLQAKYAKKEGLSQIRWTFDPLFSKNAYFNFHKLGTTSRSYKPNYYGVLKNQLNGGLESDRLIVTWHLDQSGTRVDADKAQKVECTITYKNGFPCIDNWKPVLSRYVLLPVPASIEEIKANELEVAQKWQMALREMFMFYFNQNYSVVDFLFQKNRELQYYILAVNGGCE